MMSFRVLQSCGLLRIFVKHRFMFCGTRVESGGAIPNVVGIELAEKSLFIVNT